jgi:4-hydroxybenzoate polyprenyltransferase
MAIYMAIFMGGTPIGAPMVGWLAGTAGPRWGLLGGGLVCLLATVAIAVIVARRRGMTPADLADRLTDAAHRAASRPTDAPGVRESDRAA